MTLAARIETIEASYEFMLAYAAQGRVSESGSNPSIRKTLTEMRDAASGLVDAYRAEVAAFPNALNQFADVLGADMARAVAAIDVALAVPSIGSQLVDNLNASVHARTVLTDLFLIDETIKALRRN